MTHLSDYLEDAILDHIVGTASLTSPTAWGSLHDDHPVETGANELTGIQEWGTGDGRAAQFGTVRGEIDATVIDDGWFPCGNWGEGEEAGVLPGCAMEWECNGRLLVPPRHSISLHVVAGTTGQTFNVGASWWRVQV